MKKTLLMLVMATISYYAYAQIPTQIVTGPGNMFVYVGSLTSANDNSGNSQKIIVKILGGSWFGDSNGETTFYISNRGGLTINQTSLGSNTIDKLVLRAYQNSTSIDFYLIPNPSEYTSFAVTSYTFGNLVSPGFVNITTRSTAPAATDITGSITTTPVMVTNSLGNIGIGTSLPDTRLAVNGTIHAKKIVIDLNGWADYVFQPDYLLPELSEVKSYIDQHQHLPDMPSEQEIKKTGMDVTEINKLLTKKVEELTLYLIGEYEKNMKQEDRIKILEAKLERIASDR